MKKVLLVLSGITASGKTTTINSVIRTLKDKYPLSKIKYLGNNQENSLKNTKNGGDRRVVLCDLGEKSIKIGINTAGDDGEMVMQSMTLFDDYGCNIVICTTKASIRTDEGSIATMQREIIKRQDVIQVIPIFKIMFKKHDHALNDEFMKEVIINQLMQFI